MPESCHRLSLRSPHNSPSPRLRRRRRPPHRRSRSSRTTVESTWNTRSCWGAAAICSYDSRRRCSSICFMLPRWLVCTHIPLLNLLPIRCYSLISKPYISLHTKMITMINAATTAAAAEAFRPHQGSILPPPPDRQCILIQFLFSFEKICICFLAITTYKLYIHVLSFNVYSSVYFSIR